MHTAMMWGGPRWGFRNADVPQRELYENSLVKFHQAVKRAGADVVLDAVRARQHGPLPAVPLEARPECA